MDAESTLLKRLEIIARMKALKPRFVRLAKEKGMSVIAFSKKYKFNDSHLSHQMAGRRGATEKYANKVDKCLKKEGF